jgi:hypothetical protein
MTLPSPCRWPAVAALCAATLPALAVTDADLRRCRAIADDRARLTCYDALVPAATGGERGPAATPPAPATGATTPPAPATAAAPAAAPDSSFGLRQRADPLDAIESTIPGRFDGWEPNTRLTLANGQVWQISDGSRGVYRLDNPKVRIRKGVLGSFFLEIEGQNQSPRVRRVQ